MSRAALLDMELRYVADDGVVVATTLGQVDEARWLGAAGPAAAFPRRSAALLRAVLVSDDEPRGVREPAGA